MEPAVDDPLGHINMDSAVDKKKKIHITTLCVDLYFIQCAFSLSKGQSLS